MSRLIIEVDPDGGSQSGSVRKLHSVETLIWSKLLVQRDRKQGGGGGAGVDREDVLLQIFCLKSRQNMR